MISLMKSQDIAYISHISQVNKSKISKLDPAYHAAIATTKSLRAHTVFVEDDQEFIKFKPRVSVPVSVAEDDEVRHRA